MLIKINNYKIKNSVPQSHYTSGTQMSHVTVTAILENAESAFSSLKFYWIALS